MSSFFSLFCEHYGVNIWGKQCYIMHIIYSREVSNFSLCNWFSHVKFWHKSDQRSIFPTRSCKRRLVLWGGHLVPPSGCGSSAVNQVCFVTKTDDSTSHMVNCKTKMEDELSPFKHEVQECIEVAQDIIWHNDSAWCSRIIKVMMSITGYQQADRTLLPDVLDERKTIILNHIWHLHFNDIIVPHRDWVSWYGCG